MTSNFKIYDPVSQLVADGGGGLPLSGGTLTGNLNMSIPSKIIQCQTPSDSCDLVNLIYLQQSYLPLEGGTINGPIIQAFPPSNPNEVVNKAYVDTFKYGSYLFRSTFPIFLNSMATSNAFSTGNGTIGPDIWSDPNISCTMDNNGVVTIINNLTSITYFKLTFIACNLDESMDGPGLVGCGFFDEGTNQSFFGIGKTLKCLPTAMYNLDNETFTNEVQLVALKSVAPNSQFAFSVKLQNLGPDIVTIDANTGANTSHLIVDRVV